MAGNGDAQRLEQIERAVMGARRPDSVEATNSTTNSTADDVVARVDAAAELCREAGRYAREHGAYLDELSTAFADKLRAMTADYASNMLAAEERRMAELRRILGKIAG
jgi:hypothetical protein